MGVNRTVIVNGKKVRVYLSNSKEARKQAEAAFNQKYGTDVDFNTMRKREKRERAAAPKKTDAQKGIVRGGIKPEVEQTAAQKIAAMSAAEQIALAKNIDAQRKTQIKDQALPSVASGFMDRGPETISAKKTLKGKRTSTIEKIESGQIKSDFGFSTLQGNGLTQIGTNKAIDILASEQRQKQTSKELKEQFGLISALKSKGKKAIPYQAGGFMYGDPESFKKTSIDTFGGVVGSRPAREPVRKVPSFADSYVQPKEQSKARKALSVAAGFSEEFVVSPARGFIKLSIPYQAAAAVEREAVRLGIKKEQKLISMEPKNWFGLKDKDIRSALITGATAGAGGLFGRGGVAAVRYGMTVSKVSPIRGAIIKAAPKGVAIGGTAVYGGLTAMGYKRAETPYAKGQVLGTASREFLAFGVGAKAATTGFRAARAAGARDTMFRTVLKAKVKPGPTARSVPKTFQTGRYKSPRKGVKGKVSVVDTTTGKRVQLTKQQYLRTTDPSYSPSRPQTTKGMFTSKKGQASFGLRRTPFESTIETYRADRQPAFFGAGVSTGLSMSSAPKDIRIWKAPAQSMSMLPTQPVSKGRDLMVRDPTTLAKRPSSLPDIYKPLSRPLAKVPPGRSPAKKPRSQPPRPLDVFPVVPKEPTLPVPKPSPDLIIIPPTDIIPKPPTDIVPKPPGDIIPKPKRPPIPKPKRPPIKKPKPRKPPTPKKTPKISDGFPGLWSPQLPKQLGGGSYTKPRGGGRGRGFRKYTPSLAAITFDIRGSAPKGKLTGLEFRPIRGKKKKKDEDKKGKKGKKKKKTKKKSINIFANL